MTTHKDGPGSAYDGEAELALLLRKIEREQGIPCAGYKDRCLARRVGVRMRANAVHTYADYARVLDNTASEWEKLLAALTINVTRFFRDGLAFEALEREAYPLLRDTFPGTLQVWSAGCSHGQEPYSLAMGLAETVGFEGFRVEATDVDERSLAASKEARYEVPAMVDVPPARRLRWFTSEESPTVKQALRTAVSVRRHDLLRDPIPEQRFHLIVCRNVVIYFSRTAQATLFEALHRALVPGGMLMLGKVETLTGASRDTFRIFNLRERLFQRPGA